jgi:enterochelin esterase-like enzyme
MTHTAALFRSIELSDPEFESGGLRHLTVRSRHLVGRGDITLHVPKWKSTDLPPSIVLLLHGIYSSHWAWAAKGGVHRIHDQLIAAGRVRPMILAMPSDGLWGDGSGYVAHGNADFERWIVEDVPAVVREVIPGTDPTARLYITGLSMGGFGAMALGARHPSIFGGISAHSAVTQLSQLKPVAVPDPTLAAAPDAPTDLHEALTKCPDLPPLRFDCGTGDFLLEANTRLHEDLQKRGIRHQFETPDGAHTWDYWRTHVHRSLEFFSHLGRDV